MGENGSMVAGAVAPDVGPAESAVALSEKLESLYNEITQLTVIEAAELVKAMEERLGVSAAAPVAVAQGAAGPAPAAEEQTMFDVIIKGAGAKKIAVIKAVRELTNLGLKEAKAVVDSAPNKVCEGVSKEDAEAAKKKLEEQGAAAEIQ